MKNSSLTRQNISGDNFRKKVRKHHETLITIGDVGDIAFPLNVGILKLPRRRR